MAKKPRKTPAHQGNGAGKGGIIPPVEHRFQPGQSGNPRGRPNCGATIREWVNVLSDAKTPEPDLRKLAKNVKEDPNKRAAAIRILRLLEVPDIADFEDVLNGDQTLRDARKAGVNTEIIKRVKVRTVTRKDGDTEVTREIEVRDSGKTEFENIVNTTDGMPVQRQEVHETRELKISMDELAARLLERGFTIEQLPAELRERAKRVESRVIESKGGAK